MFHALLSALSGAPSGAAVTAWLLTYLLHSTLFLGLAWLLARGPLRHRPALEEAAWRFALVAALVTASIQVAAGREPLAGRWGLSVPTKIVAEATSFAPAPALRPEAIGRPILLSRRPATAAPLPAPAPARLPWTALIPGLWAAGALALGLRWLAAHLILHRRLRARPDVVGGDMHRALRRLAGEAGLPDAVRLTVSSRLPVPVALGLRRREICVPPKAVAALSTEEQEGLLAHELAHLVRRDPFWLALSQFLASILFFQPLNLVARRRLREISELRSDEWAVGQTGRPLFLARCLAEVAGWSMRPLSTLVVPGMADRPSHLAHRIRRLLDHARSPERAVRPLWLAAGMAVLLIAVAAAAPGVSAAGPHGEEPALAGPQGDGPEGSPPAGSGPQGTAPRLAGPTGAGPIGSAPKIAGDVTINPNDPNDPNDPDIDIDPPDVDVDIDPPGVNVNVDIDPPDIDIDPELDLDIDIDPHLEGALAGLSDEAWSAATPGLEAALATLGEHSALSEEEEKALEQKLDAMNDELENRLKPHLEELERRIEKEMEGLEKSPAMEKLRAQTEDLARRARPSETEMAELHARIEAMKADGEVTREERDRIRAEARQMAEKYRMSEKDRAELRELAQKAREESQRFMKEHGAEIEAMRKEIRQQAAAMREDIRRRMEADPKLRALRDQQRQEMQKQREEMRKQRDEMRQEREKMRQQQKDKEKQDEKEHGRTRPVRQAAEGGMRGGFECPVQG